MTDPNYKFDEQGSVAPVSKRGWREETLLNAITADIEYKYYFYSDKEYIEKQKKY
jgi:hypothetical protein